MVGSLAVLLLRLSDRDRKEGSRDAGDLCRERSALVGAELVIPMAYSLFDVPWTPIFL